MPENLNTEVELQQKLRDIESRKRELEKIISQRQDRISQRMSDFKEDVGERLTVTSVIRKNPAIVLGAAFGTGLLIARVLRSPKPATVQLPTGAKYAVSPKPAGVVNDLAGELFGIVKSLAVSYATRKVRDYFDKR